MLGLGVGFYKLAGGDRLFSLNDIKNLVLYLKNGIGITTVLGDVSVWADQSGENNDISQATSGDRATLAEGGLDFNKLEADHYDMDSVIEIGDLDGFTIIIVCKFESMGAHATVLGLNNTQHFLEFMAGNDNIRIRLASTNTTITPDDNNLFANDTKFIMTLVREEGETGNLILYKNGTLISQASAGQAANNGDAEFITVGTRNADRYFDGIIHELAVYKKALSQSELADAHSYLLNKHGI